MASSIPFECVKVVKGDSSSGKSERLYFGGSFNPIHHGHLICARAAAEAAGFGKVALVPSHRPPHKPEAKDLASAKERCQMCQLVAADSRFYEVDELEIGRNGPSYTIETARELRLRGIKRVNWLIGADMLAFLPQWHEAEKLIQEVNFIVMARPGWEFDWEGLAPKFRKLKSQVVKTPLIDISATEIRERVRRGLSIEYLVPEAVGDYIRKRGLYR